MTHRARIAAQLRACLIALLFGAPASSQSSTVEACIQGAHTIRVDLYFPAVRTTRPAPMVVALFGGGYATGSRTKFNTVPAYIKYPDSLLHRGIVVAAVDMRLSTEAPFPAMVQDARCAVRYLRSNAAQWSVDPDRIGALGISSGGHVALLLALATNVRDWDSGPQPAQSGSVRAAVSVGSPIDLRPAMIREHFQRELTRLLGAANAANWWLGMFAAADPDAATLAAFSPLTYVRADGPPILFFQALSDEWNHPESASLLLRAMISLRAPGTVRLFPGSHEEMIADESVIAHAAVFLANALTSK